MAESVVTRDGREFAASSSDTPYPVYDDQVRGVIDRADPREEWHGHCALPRAIEEALGPPHNMTMEDFRGASVGSAQIGPEGTKGHGGVHTAVR